MAPAPEMRSINFERRQITLTPSSNDRASETTAAAASPIECPMTAPGFTPYEAMAAANDTCMANNVG
ncbi:Uncharacterised protein [Mycobacteroides abscessus subsp. massiliense]|nr:Uncharacterised protein [Mycobacteroides abscessus subsp. massiliense]